MVEIASARQHDMHTRFFAAEAVDGIRQGDRRGVEKSERVLQIDVGWLNFPFPDEMGSEVIEVLGIAQGFAQSKHHLDANVVLDRLLEYGFPSGLVEDVEANHNDVPEVVLDPSTKRDVSHVFGKHFSNANKADFALFPGQSYSHEVLGRSFR